MLQDQGGRGKLPELLLNGKNYIPEITFFIFTLSFLIQIVWPMEIAFPHCMFRLLIVLFGHCFFPLHIIKLLLVSNINNLFRCFLQSLECHFYHTHFLNTEIQRFGKREILIINFNLYKSLLMLNRSCDNNDYLIIVFYRVNKWLR